MVFTQQVQPQQVQPGQLVYPGQLAAVPATNGAFDIGTLLTSLMPLIMMILMFQLLKPMISGMAGTAETTKK